MSRGPKFSLCTVVTANAASDMFFCDLRQNYMLCWSVYPLLFETPRLMCLFTKTAIIDVPTAPRDCGIGAEICGVELA